ncbi:MAG TPA: biopolymer transporter ExbD [Marinilabiliales bacterium]|jgi:biopolymer transport protein ExbD|nr:MAG: biopolymer transporter ExbD [Bacteroidetes bacterium GWA2_40_14]OFX59947.1 MAG: biopolymer transporter ExbD [Bacteroidetes bacterium GWC2_40_13]OFX76262.1 MAG: biopolymer transporter ExbD [Bacteroidetes bacterium GWD2_40_43]OFX95765.1 MAG: biopolymer transporter ExbD [Bacteroidetes bacterium GWE2_40_63]OFY21728.1 MAG: biopolymer transporter ExbD [Bacteroidetes bacterium GWF2_40_13]OFZ23912.1 MAG: biopolymer transporter ExbD [Bacteroidetes bacterium RIFOXYC2_FULL_40_12]HAM98777.1 biopo
MSKKTPEIPSASMADIAFMLLIFFLVTTTMDTDSGISRMLPPPVPPDEQNDDDVKIKERNVFVVLINKNDQLMVEGQPMHIKELKEKAKEFIENPTDSETLPEKEAKEIPFFGTTMISKQVVSLQNDRGTSYGIYIQAQDELAAAYNELRDELALRKFGKKYDDLDLDRQDAIRDVYPQRISEAEPKNYGGNN